MNAHAASARSDYRPQEWPAYVVKAVVTTRSLVDASGRHVIREPGFSESLEEVINVV